MRVVLLVYRPDVWKLLCQDLFSLADGVRLVVIMGLKFHLKRLDVEGPAAAAIDLSPWCPAFDQ